MLIQQYIIYELKGIFYLVCPLSIISKNTGVIGGIEGILKAMRTRKVKIVDQP
jgi:hypothetical protein